MNFILILNHFSRVFWIWWVAHTKSNWYHIIHSIWQMFYNSCMIAWNPSKSILSGFKLRWVVHQHETALTVLNRWHNGMAWWILDQILLGGPNDDSKWMQHTHSTHNSQNEEYYHQVIYKFHYSFLLNDNNLDIRGFSQYIYAHIHFMHTLQWLQCVCYWNA